MPFVKRLPSVHAGSAALCVSLLVMLSACTDRPARASASPAPGDAARAASAHAEQSLDLAEAIRAALDRLVENAHDWSSTERLELDALYRTRADAPLWIDASARPTADAREAIELLTGAGAEGLDPADYGAPDLERAAALIGSGATPSPRNLAAFDVGLSLGTVRYFRNLHTGRVTPQAVGFRIASRADEHDFAALVRDAVMAHRVRRAAEELTPPLAAYRNLRGLLTSYRNLAADTTLVPPALSPATVHPGEPYAGLVELHRLLVAVGDLPADTPAPNSSWYEGVLVDGVRRFQLRHGLEVDGVLGRSTQAALRVPMAARVRQIELSLERLRWLPHLGDGPFIAVNIPMFRLWTWDSVPVGATPTSSMGVIVGRARETETPVFIQEMSSVIFRPYWNVPPSIARGEILPAIRRNRDYLERQNMEIVSGQSDAATPVPLSNESLARVARGELRVRQRPGPGNALGLVKFVFPNDENIYMHATPKPELFNRSRRDFSHGCIRVEDPVALAEWVLENEPDWTHERIVSAMHGTESLTVKLSKPVRVVLFYATAVALPEDGSARFAEDIYRHDAALEHALGRR